MNERAFLAETTGAFLKEIYVLDLICLVYFNWVKGGFKIILSIFFGLSGTLPYLRLPFFRVNPIYSQPKNVYFMAVKMRLQRHGSKKGRSTLS